MDLSNFVTYDKKEYLLLSIAKSNQEIFEFTHSEPQETLQFKMNKENESFSFDVPFELQEQWMMGITSLEVNNTVYNITPINSKLEILLTEQQLKSLNIVTGLVLKAEYLNKTSDNEFVEKANKFKVDYCSKTRNFLEMILIN